MRARSREVNIFNMSLLDILTGMLGASLFLMLGLVPYYTKAKKQDNAPQTPVVNTPITVISHTDSAAHVDFLLYTPTGWCGSNTKSVPLSGRSPISNAACPHGDSWQVVSTFGHVGERYLVCVSPQGPVDPEVLRNVGFSIDMLEAQNAPDGSGIKSYYPDAWVSHYDASGAQPGNVYGVGWIEVTKDTSKTTNPDDFNSQYDYTFNGVKAGDSLPDGVVPLPPPAPVSAAPVVTQSLVPTVVQPSPAPSSAPTPTPTPTPTPSQGPAPNPSQTPAPPATFSFWDFFNWFHHAPAPAQK